MTIRRPRLSSEGEGGLPEQAQFNGAVPEIPTANLVKIYFPKSAPYQMARLISQPTTSPPIILVGLSKVLVSVGSPRRA
jgi:hypothetical protein